MNRKLLAAVISAALAGCSLSPDYERPAAPVPGAWPSSATPGEKHLGTPKGWQQYFPDPRLQALITAALENNRDLRIATARISEARAQYGVQRADRFPNVNITASRNASLTPAGASSFTANAIQTQRYDAGIGLLSYELDFWGRVGSLSEAAKANYLATEAAQRAFRLSLISDVANAYLTVLELRERVMLTSETARARGETREMVSRRRQAGISSDMDFLQAEGAYQASLAEHANLERQLAAAENLLDLLVGQYTSQIQNLPAERSLSEQGIVPAMIAGLPAEVLLRRPDVMAAEQRLIAANANIGAARAAFLPRITLTGSAGSASRSLAGLFDKGSKAWSFQPALSMPLFDAGRTSANVDIAHARKVIAVAEYEKTLQQAFREVADLLSAGENLDVQLEAQSTNAQLQKKRLSLVEARYQAGIASHLEVLDAQREAYAAEQSAAQARRAKLSVAVQLYKALAWDNDALSGRTSPEDTAQ